MPAAKFVVPAPWRLIEQYFRPEIADVLGGRVTQVKQPSVNVKVAPEPPQLSVAETGLVGKVVYAPGSVTAPIADTLPPEMVAVNVAGELVVV